MIAHTKVMMAGTKKHHAHGGSGILVLAQIDGMYIPRMFPSGVCVHTRDQGASLDCRRHCAGKKIKVITLQTLIYMHLSNHTVMTK